MRESVIYQDILQQGLQQGRREGKQEGEVALILRFLKRRIGEIDPMLQEQIRGLSTEQLEELAEAVLDFSEVADLVAWLKQQTISD